MRKLLTFAGLIALFYAGFILIAPMFFGLPETRRTVSPIPESAGIAHETIRFPSTQHPLMLTGWWMPAEEMRGVIILVHGFRGQREIPRFGGIALAAQLIEAGYSVLSFDLRNHGESDEGPNGDLVIADLPHDLTGAINWVKAQAPAQPIGVIGVSLGGDVVIRTAAGDNRIDALVTVDGAFEPLEASYNFMVQERNVPPFLARQIVWSMQHVHRIWPKENAIEIGKRLEGSKLLLIHNEADPVSPASGAHKLKASLPDAEVWITPKPAADNPVMRHAGRQGSHVLSYLLYREQFLETVLDFLERRLGSD